MPHLTLNQHNGHIVFDNLTRPNYNPPMRICLAYMAVALAAAWLTGCADLASRPAAFFDPTMEAPSAKNLPAPDDLRTGNVPSRRSLLSPTSTPAETSTAVITPVINRRLTYGYSFGGRPLVAYRLGHGPTARALIGGLHGGYEWNTTALMSRTLEYLAAVPERIPSELTLYIIPLANPDGAAAGSDRVDGRMNGNGVDLNRNWDYQWQMTATHGLRPVFAGRHPFSEPETAALRDFIQDGGISTVIFYHSAGAEVYSGAGAATSKTVELAQWMAAHTGYRYAQEGIPGEITTGNAIDWLTTNGIAAVEIELATHGDVDWEPNLKAILAFLNWDLPPVRRAYVQSE